MLRIAFIVLLTLTTGLFLRPDINGKSAYVYPEQLPGTFTGGFGEQTCHSCHFDYPLNPEEGSLMINGIPSSYEPGKTYSFRIRVSRKNLGRAGFQLSARYADSTQAGSLSPDQDRTGFTNVSNDIQYVQHSPEGTKPNGSDTSSWSIKWTAPKQNNRIITFNIAANAANGDNSEFSDFIFTRKIISTPQTGN